MVQFIEGNTYETRSIGDHNCIFNIRVIRRTNTMIKYEYEGHIRSSKIRVDKSGEYIRPDNYSFAPIFRAERQKA